MRRGGHQKPIRIARARVARERPNIRYVGDRLRIALDDLAAGIARNVDLLANKLHGHERSPPIHARLDDLRRANADERRLQRMFGLLARANGSGEIVINLVRQQRPQRCRITLGLRRHDHLKGSAGPIDEATRLEIRVGNFDLRKAGFQRRACGSG